MDLVFAQNLAGRKVWIADVHSHTKYIAAQPFAAPPVKIGNKNRKESSGLEKKFGNSIVSDPAFDNMVQTLCRFGLLVLHVDAHDFTDGPAFTCINPAVKDLLFRAQIVIFRDYNITEHEALVHYLRSFLGSN